MVVTPPKSADSPAGTLPPVGGARAADARSVTVTATKPADSSPTAIRIDEQDLASQRAATSDSARLLQDIPGVSLYGAGGISSLPAIHGMADDRVRVQVDGMDVMSVVPQSHELAALLHQPEPGRAAPRSLPASLRSVSGGTASAARSSWSPLHPSSPAPRVSFSPGGGPAASFAAMAGRYGYDFGVAMAGRDLGLSYRESTAQSDNYSAASAFKAVRPGGTPPRLAGRGRSGSSAYDGATNRDIGLALRHEDHLLQLKLGRQIVRLRGFPEPAHGHDLQREHADQPALHGIVSSGATWKRAPSGRTPGTK